MSLFAGKRRRLVLHIGLSDTGTQSIQRTLAAQRTALATHGIVVPRAGIQREGHHELAWQLGFARGKPPASAMKPEQIVDAWHAELGQAKGAAGLVSSEYFSLPGDHAALHALLEPRFDTQVVLYLHRHDLWMPHVYARAVRSNTAPRWGRGYENFLNFRKSHDGGQADRFRPIVDAWARIVGKENVLVRPFEPSQIGSCITADLLRTMDAPAAAISGAESGHVEDDPAPTFESLHLMDIVQHTSLPAEIKRHLVQRFAARNPGLTPGVPLASPGYRSGQIASNFDDYEYVAQRFLGRRDGILFRDPTPTDEAATWKAPALFTNMWMTERLCEALGEGDESTWRALQALARDTPAAGEA